MTIRWLLLVSTVACLSFLVGCSSRPVGPPGGAFDAGAVFAVKTPVLTHTFLLTNTTGRAVRIMDESHTCTCTQVDLERKTLKPGEGVPLTMSVSVPQGYSSLDLGCAVLTDHPELKEWRYRMRFRSFPNARIVPDRINLGSHGSDGAGGGDEVRASRAYLEVFTPAGGRPLRPGAVTVGPELAAVLDPTPTVDLIEDGVQRARYAITIDLDGKPRSDGLSSRDLTVGMAEGLPASALVVWSNVLPVTCAPAQIHFGMVADGDLPKSAKVVITSNRGAPFIASPVNRDPGPVRVKTLGDAARPSPSHTIELTLSDLGDGPSTALSGSASVKTDLSDMPEVEIPWSAFPRRAKGRTVPPNSSARSQHERGLR